MPGKPSRGLADLAAASTVLSDVDGQAGRGGRMPVWFAVDAR